MYTVRDLTDIGRLRRRAYRLSQRYVKVDVFRDSVFPNGTSPNHDGSLLLNPYVRYYKITPKPKAPAWVHKQFVGYKYYGNTGDETQKEIETTKIACYLLVADAIMRRNGYMGYVQDELPF